MLHAPCCNNNASCVLLKANVYSFFRMPSLYCSTFSENQFSTFHNCIKCTGYSFVCFSLCSFCSHLTSEMTKCREEMVSKDSELQRLRKDVNDKTSHISRLDENLQHIKRQLDSKSDMCRWHSVSEVQEISVCFCFYIYIYIYIYTVYNSFCKEGPIEGRATRSFAPLSKTNLNLGSLFALSFDGLTSVFFASFPSK